jgi:hypothetical protein
MKRYGRKIHWNAKAVVGFGLAVTLIFAATQTTNYFRYWIWTPNTGHRIAGFSSGHFERRYPAVLLGGPTVGFVLVARGERLTVDYDVTIQEGTVAFAVWKWPVMFNRSRKIGPRLISESGRGRIEFIADSWGFYELYMYAHSWQGAVSVDWRTDDPPPRHAVTGGG